MEMMKIPDTTLHKLFEEQVEVSNDSIALQFESETLNYGELNKKANQLAHLLNKSGIGPDTPVGVLTSRSFEMIIAILAVLKSGGAYIPFDPEYPMKRLQYMIENSGVKFILTRKREVSSFSELNATTFCIDDPSWLNDQPAVNLNIEIQPSNLSYIIYTSGSTGNPKGAMNTHLAAVNRLLWMKEELKLKREDVFIQKTPFSFDVSVWELFLPLILGSRMVIAKPGGHRDPDYLLDLIHKEKISIIHFVPSMLRLFLQSSDLNRANCLKTVVCSGEILHTDIVKSFFNSFEAQLYNLYGPTEAAVDVTFYHCLPDDNRKFIPIGRPIWNTSIYIVNESGNLANKGETGELCIGGLAVGRGYLNRPDLTAVKFIPDPFSGDPKAKIYKTGDLGRYLDCGDIEYLGRIDFQVKIRGFRIELNEIESVLRKIKGVKDCVVIALKNCMNEDLLVGYVVEMQKGKLSNLLIRKEISLHLPEYMVPSFIVTLDSFPVTPNGKLDRSALPVPWKECEISEKSENFLNDTESIISDFWIKLLGNYSIGLNQNFFDAGGTSFMILQLKTKIKNTFGIDVPISILFQYPTVRSLAAYLRNKSLTTKNDNIDLIGRAEKQRTTIEGRSKNIKPKITT